jgi:hypothetical protein
MPLILRRSLIFFALLIGGLVLYSLWYGIKADRYEETAVPYLESALPILTSWQYEQLKPILSPAARLDFENKKLQAAYRLFSQLGQLKSIGKPQYISNRNDTSKALGDFEIINYQVPLQFDSGPAVIKITLVADGKSYYIRHFGFHSEIFAAKTTTN